MFVHDGSFVLGLKACGQVLFERRVLGLSSESFRWLERLFYLTYDDCNESREKRFSQNADADDHERPCEQVRRCQVDLGFVEVFAYRHGGQADYLSGYARFPAHSQRKRTGSLEIGQDLGGVDETKTVKGVDIEYVCHFEQAAVGLLDAFEHCGVDDGKRHEK